MESATWFSAARRRCDSPVRPWRSRPVSISIGGMEIKPLDRIAALAGSAYVLLAVVGHDILGKSSPDSTASAHAIGSWWRSHDPTTADWVSAFLEFTALLLFPVFVIVLAWTLRQAERRATWLPWLVLGSGLLSAVIKLASAEPIFALAWRNNQISDQLAAALVDMNAAAFVLTWALDALMLAGAGTVILHTRCLPRALGWSAVVIAPLLLATVPLADSGPPIFLLALLWIVATSITLALRGARIGSSQAAAAGAVS
jgi:hypothetical protein